MYRMAVLPIENWGLGCPGHLRRSAEEQLSALGIAMGPLLNPLLGQHLVFEPLDPRAESPSFFHMTEREFLFGVYSPEEGNAHDVAAKVKAAFSQDAERFGGSGPDR